jgi:predicted ATPase
LPQNWLLPELGEPNKVVPDRSHLFDAVVQLLATWAKQKPLLVILDDIHWIDEASSALLHYASRLLSHLPVQFACTARAVELNGNTAIAQVIQTLRREQRLQTLELSPLDRSETADLIRNIKLDQVPQLSLEMIDQVFHDSGGNPLFALEVTRALSVSTAPHTENLALLIGDRLQQLDPDARDILPWAAALGRSFQPTRIAQVADYPLTQLCVNFARSPEILPHNPIGLSRHPLFLICANLPQ